MAKCTDQCVQFANGYQLPYNPATPGNYTLPGYNQPLSFGVTPEYLNESRNGAAITAILTIFIISMIVSSTRIYARGTIATPGFGWDDWILVLTAGLYIAFVGLAIKCIDLGEGRHLDWIVLQGLLDDSVVAAQESVDFTLHIVYNTALFCCRLSALAFYQRFTTLKSLCIAGYVTVTCFYLAQMFLLIFHCNPVTALWPYDFQSHSSKFTCLGWGLVYLINSCLSVVSDLVIFIIPAVLLSRHNASRTVKLQLALVLFPGVLVIGVSVARLGILVKGLYDPDQSWYYGPMVGLEGGEIGGTMMCISVPALTIAANSIYSRVQRARFGTNNEQLITTPPSSSEKVIQHIDEKVTDDV